MRRRGKYSLGASITTSRGCREQRRVVSSPHLGARIGSHVPPFGRSRTAPLRLRRQFRGDGEPVTWGDHDNDMEVQWQMGNKSSESKFN